MALGKRTITLCLLTAALGALVPAHRAVAQRSWIAVCPLSEQQTKASISAFAKIVPTLTGEPRCVNCHGGLNPETDRDRHDPVVLPAANRGPNETTDCTDCHDNMVNRTKGQKSEWHLAPAFLQFVNKSDRELCEQIKGEAEGPCANGTCDPWPLAEKFIGHMTDDEGRDNFTATAFAGTRGLSDAVPILPGITHPQLLALGNAWVATTGGEWQGSRDCGCEPNRYALRVSAITVITGSTFRNDMGPVDIPIAFRDDGSFVGDSAVKMRSSDRDVPECIAQGSASTHLVASGKAVQTYRERYLEVEIKSASATTSQGSVQCPDQSMQRSFSGTSNDVWKVRMEGTVGEAKSFPAPTPDPAVRTTARIEIVKLKD